MKNKKTRPCRVGVALSSVLLATALGGLFLAWVEMGLRECRNQRAAVEAFQRLGGEVRYDWFQYPNKAAYDPRVSGPREFLYATPWWNSRRWLAAATGRAREFATVGLVGFCTDRAMTDADWEYFCGAFASARYVHIVCPLHDAQLRFLARMRNLEELRIAGRDEGPFITGEGFAHLAGLRRLRSLGLQNIRLSAAGKKALGKLESLECLGLSDETDDDTLAHLTGLKRLEYLGASTKTTNAGLFHVRKMPALRCLVLAGARITDDGLRHLVGLKITELDLRETGVTDRGIAYLAQMPELSALDLDDTALTDAAAHHLGKLRHLESLNLTRTALTDAAIPDLEKLKHLEVLILHGTKNSVAGCKKLRGALPKLKLLQMPDGSNILTEHTNGKTKEIRPKNSRAQMEAGKR